MISEDRIYLLFFVFFCLILYFHYQNFFIVQGKINLKKFDIYYNSTVFKPLRNDIIDRNGIPTCKKY